MTHQSYWIMMDVQKKTRSFVVLSVHLEGSYALRNAYWQVTRNFRELCPFKKLHDLLYIFQYTELLYKEYSKYSVVGSLYKSGAVSNCFKSSIGKDGLWRSKASHFHGCFAVCVCRNYSIHKGFALTGNESQSFCGLSASPSRFACSSCGIFQVKVHLWDIQLLSIHLMPWNIEFWN